MAERMSDDAQTAALAGDSPPQSPLDSLSAAESWKLISGGGVGRIGYSGRYGPTVLPVNYTVQDNAIYFRISSHSSMGEDLRTGIANADYKVAFQIDHFDETTRAGWSVLIQGDVHPMESEEEFAAASQTGVESWVAGDRNLFMRITPTRVTGHCFGQLSR